ncbi:MAG: hypothetical protein HRU14_07685 [Planctomycetes bacterium]|nr:hypothetical protein [Planctomycetota bacterium]
MSSLLNFFVAALPRLLTYDHHGLFAHNNAHHPLYMAHATAGCLDDGRMGRDRWAEYHEEFTAHVAEDYRRRRSRTQTRARSPA